MDKANIWLTRLRSDCRGTAHISMHDHTRWYCASRFDVFQFPVSNFESNNIEIKS